MSSVKSVIAYHEWLTKQLIPKQPTTKEIEWAKKNFSSRVTHPKN